MIATDSAVTTDDNTASTWRDIADQLTGQQRAELEGYEHAGMNRRH